MPAGPGRNGLHAKNPIRPPAPYTRPVSRVIACNVVGGTAERQLENSLPTFVAYAARFGYELCIESLAPAGRSPHWGKIQLLLQLVEEHELVVWLDSDAMIVDYSQDIATGLREGCFQALLLEQEGVRWNPNSGVWVLRGVERSSHFLQKVWDIGPQEHIFNDQAAIMKALGWGLEDFPFGCKLVAPSDYLRDTCWLAPEWNRIPALYPHIEPRINHWAGGPDQAERRIFEMAELLEAQRRSGLVL